MANKSIFLFKTSWPDRDEIETDIFSFSEEIKENCPFVGLGTLFIFRDLAGDYLRNSKMYESEEYIVLDYNLD